VAPGGVAKEMFGGGSVPRERVPGAVVGVPLGVDSPIVI